MGVIFSPLGKVTRPRSSAVTLQPRHARGLLKDEVRSKLLAGQERRDLSMKLGPTWYGAGHEHSLFIMEATLLVAGEAGSVGLVTNAILIARDQGMFLHALEEPSRIHPTDATGYCAMRRECRVESISGHAEIRGIGIQAA